MYKQPGCRTDGARPQDISQKTRTWPGLGTSRPGIQGRSFELSSSES